MATATDLGARLKVASASFTRAKRTNNLADIDYWAYAIDQLLDQINDEKRDSACR